MTKRKGKWYSGTGKRKKPDTRQEVAAKCAVGTVGKEDKKEVVSITLRDDSEDWEGEWDYFDDEEERRGVGGYGKKSTEIKEAISEKVFSLYE